MPAAGERDESSVDRGVNGGVISGELEFGPVDGAEEEGEEAGCR